MAEIGGTQTRNWSVPLEREMVDEFMVCVDRLIQSGCCEPGNGAAVAAANGGGVVEARRGLGVAGGGCGLPMEGGCGEEGSSNTVPLMKERVGGLIGGSIECRICQEEGEEGDMESPCACNGTLKFAHRKCIQKWCNKKGDITCEICNQVYAPNYSAPPARSNPDGLAIDIRHSWGQQMDLHAALASAEHELLRAEYEDYATAHNNGIACCRAVALILMFLLLIRHALMVTRDSGMVEDISAFFNVSLLQLAGIVLPCYVIVRSCYIMHSRRRRQAYLRQIWC